MNKPTRPTPSPARPVPRRRSIFAWTVRNLALLLVSILLLSTLRSTTYGNWLWNYYAKANLQFIQSYPDLTLDERLAAKLGSDYRFLLFLREQTPEDAVLYYPTGDDFRSVRDQSGQSLFSGQLTDKLTAVRFLYPRRIVVEKELHKTSYTDSLTFITILSPRNRELIPYPIDPAFTIGVLPVTPPDSSSIDTATSNP